MQAENALGVDWRDAAAYAPLLDADRYFIAWEWLRRDPDYRAAATRALPIRAGARVEDSAARPFGLIAFEDPGLCVPDARPVWRLDACSLALVVERSPAGGLGDAFNLDRLHHLVTLVRGDSAEHLLLSDGLRAIRLDGPRGLFSNGPARLLYLIEGLLTLGPQLLTLRRFVALCQADRFAPSLHPREPRARRWILMLRAWDGLCSGVSQRQIAEVLLSGSAREPRWRSSEPSLRSQVQRLTRAARAFAGGGYLTVLRGKSASR